MELDKTPGQSSYAIDFLGLLRLSHRPNHHEHKSDYRHTPPILDFGSFDLAQDRF